MKAKANLQRRKRIKARNAARAKRARARDFGPRDRQEWVNGLPSVVSGRGPCVPHHVRSRGAGGTDKEIVPLTVAEHEEVHRIGRQSFEARYGLDLASEARRVDAAWVLLAGESCRTDRNATRSGGADANVGSAETEA